MGAAWSRRYTVENGELFQMVCGNHCLTTEKRDDGNFQRLAKKTQEGIDKAERSNQI